MSDVTETWEAYERSVLAFERVLHSCMVDMPTEGMIARPVDCDPDGVAELCAAFMVDSGIDPENIDDHLDLFNAWIWSSVLEVVNISRQGWTEDESTIDAVELLLAFGGPNVRLTVPVRFNTAWATLSVHWASDSYEREIYVPALSELLEDQSQFYVAQGVN